MISVAGSTEPRWAQGGVLTLLRAVSPMLGGDQSARIQLTLIREPGP